MIEARPEEVGISSPHGCEDSLLLEVDVVGILLG